MNAELNTFLSMENIERHFDYVNNLKLKLSILEKSYPSISGKRMENIQKLNINREIKEEVSDLMINIRAHELFFDSFALKNIKCDYLRKYYSSEEAFFYEVYEKAKMVQTGFLYIFQKAKGGVEIVIDDVRGFYFRKEPLFALDLYEHAYFLDYGFDRELYLKNSISHLDLSKFKNS